MSKSRGAGSPVSSSEKKEALIRKIYNDNSYTHKSYNNDKNLGIILDIFKRNIYYVVQQTSTHICAQGECNYCAFGFEWASCVAGGESTTVPSLQKGPVISFSGSLGSKSERIKLGAFESKWKAVNAPRLPNGVSELVSLVLGIGRVCPSAVLDTSILPWHLGFRKHKHFISENEDNFTFCSCQVRLGTGNYSLLLKSIPWILRGTATQKDLSWKGHRQ